MTHLTCRQISKFYGSHRVLDSVDFDLEAGSVTGLVGPNGSGKSTLIKILAGLSRPSSGGVLVNGMSPRRLSQVGAFLGTENMHPGRTVRETISLSAFLAKQPAERVVERLAWSGLASVKGRLVKGLSAGMKVRLGMALATIRHPEVLILDEPMNGLDVDGIQWIKAIVRQHSRDGGVVLLSSHLLREMEAVIDRALILSQGVVVRDVVLGEMGRSVQPICMRVNDDARLAGLLSKTSWRHQVSHGLWTIEAQQEDVARLAYEARLLVFELRTAARGALEDLFVASAKSEFAPQSEPRKT